jgi:hypothetical protein
MQYTILLDKNEKTREVEAQEQSRFIKAVMEALEVPVEWNCDEPLTVSKKIELKKVFAANKINVIDDMDGGIKVFVGNEIVAEWKKCAFKLKIDKTKIDPNKQLYLEMYVNFWTSFE